MLNIQGHKNSTEILAGQYFDDETGLHQNWHRTYNPSTGRYLRADPKGVVPYGPLTIFNNLYHYAKNNPILYHDPEGLCPERKSCLDTAWKEFSNCNKLLTAAQVTCMGVCIGITGGSGIFYCYQVCSYIITPKRLICAGLYLAKKESCEQISCDDCGERNK